MQALILGFAALAAGLLALNWYLGANTQALARSLRIMIGVAALGIAALFLVRGQAGYALPLAVTGLWLLLNALGGGSGGPRRSDGQASRIVTDMLRMELDHDTGEMRGTVLKGDFAGRAVETMSPAELAQLWWDCRFADPPSAQLIEAYLDREHEGWREGFERAGGAAGGGAGSGGDAGGAGMSRTEAFAILGLAEGASTDEIRAAHRELMKRVHPDRGGSGYLAAKINAAKAVLLGD